MSNYDEDKLPDDILSIDKESQSDLDFYEDEANINVSGYSSNDEIDDDIPGKFDKK
jgi:hypothetical protein